MRIAILSDIHANWVALQAVIAQVEQAKCEVYWFLGDLIGYNAQPVECVQWFKTQFEAGAIRYWVVGNHDANLVGLDIQSNPNPAAKYVIDHHRYLLKGELLDWLIKIFTKDEIFVEGHLIKHHDEATTRYVCVHGSPWRLGLATDYLFPWDTFKVKLAVADLQQVPGLGNETTLVWHGHHHYPMLFAYVESRVTLHEVCYNAPTRLNQGVFFINPGSVGQPRDGDPRAAFAILDTTEQTVEFRRVEYDYKTAQELFPQHYRDQAYNRWRALATGEYDHQKLADYRHHYDDSDQQLGKKVRRQI